MKLKRYEKNPVLSPIPEHEWEARTVFNCGVVYLDGKVHILYRAQNKEGVSKIGYALSEDGFNIKERLAEPIYGPREGEIDKYGTEDPRLSLVEDKIYMSYTAYGEVPDMKVKVSRSIQVAITSIKVSDFLERRWEKFSKPHYPFPGVENKGAVIFPEKFGDDYVMYHRILPHIWIARSRDLINWEKFDTLISPQFDWEYYKIGPGAPLIKTPYGWLFIYHAVDKKKTYRLGYTIIHPHDPTKIIYRHPKPILEPEKEFELQGDVPNVVYTCGAVLIDDTVFVYYGGADKHICVATAKLAEFLKPLKIWGVK